MSKVCSHRTPRYSQASGILTFFLLLPAGVSCVTTMAPTRKGSAGVHEFPDRMLLFSLFLRPGVERVDVSCNYW